MVNWLFKITKARIALGTIGGFVWTMVYGSNLVRFGLLGVIGLFGWYTSSMVEWYRGTVEFQRQERRPDGPTDQFTFYASDFLNAHRLKGTHFVEFLWDRIYIIAIAIVGTIISSEVITWGLFTINPDHPLSGRTMFAASVIFGIAVAAEALHQFPVLGSETQARVERSEVQKRWAEIQQHWKHDRTITYKEATQGKNPGDWRFRIERPMDETLRYQFAQLVKRWTPQARHFEVIEDEAGLDPDDGFFVQVWGEHPDPGRAAFDELTVAAGYRTADSKPIPAWDIVVTDGMVTSFVTDHFPKGMQDTIAAEFEHVIKPAKRSNVTSVDGTSTFKYEFFRAALPPLVSTSKDDIPVVDGRRMDVNPDEIVVLDPTWFGQSQVEWVLGVRSDGNLATFRPAANHVMVFGQTRKGKGGLALAAMVNALSAQFRIIYLTGKSGGEMAWLKRFDGVKVVSNGHHLDKSRDALQVALNIMNMRNQFMESEELANWEYFIAKAEEDPSLMDRWMDYQLEYRALPYAVNAFINDRHTPKAERGKVRALKTWEDANDLPEHVQEQLHGYVEDFKKQAVPKDDGGRIFVMIDELYPLLNPSNPSDKAISAEIGLLIANLAGQSAGAGVTMWMMTQQPNLDSLGDHGGHIRRAAAWVFLMGPPKGGMTTMAFGKPHNDPTMLASHSFKVGEGMVQDPNEDVEYEMRACFFSTERAEEVSRDNIADAEAERYGDPGDTGTDIEVVL